MLHFLLHHFCDTYVIHMCNNHYSVARSTTLSCYPLLCRVAHYSVVAFTTPPWVPLLRRGFHLSNSLQVDLVCVNKLLQSQTRLALRHNVRVGLLVWLWCSALMRQ
jgi:hypothetical protein